MKLVEAQRARYTLEFKREAVRLVELGQTMAATERSLGGEQTLFHQIKAPCECRLQGADSSPKVSAEQGEIGRMRAELARVKM
jgi:transposase